MPDRVYDMRQDAPVVEKHDALRDGAMLQTKLLQAAESYSYIYRQFLHSQWQHMYTSANTVGAPYQ